MRSIFTRLFNNRYIRIDLSKNTKAIYYMKNIIIFLTPSIFYRNSLDSKIIDIEDEEYIWDRVNYYNKLENNYTLTNAKTIKEFKKEKKKTYFFDLYKYLIYFNPIKKISYLFGDITTIPSEPTIIKSRPIGENNQNSIIMKLNMVRHFIFVNDKIKFDDKKDILIWRGKAHQEHRRDFLDKFHNHRLCDVGQIIKKKDKGKIKWEKSKMSVKEQLEYKFILCIEGNDVASNLKWVMSSNSLAFMVKPKYETWFMEGRLIPNHHYILLKDDYSDLEEKIEYYSTHIEEAQLIINNANKYIEQFKNNKKEDIISLLVLDRYFKMQDKLLR